MRAYKEYALLRDTAQQSNHFVTLHQSWPCGANGARIC